MKILISGASGLIGSAVAEILRGRCDEVVAISRTPRDGSVYWADGAELEPEVLEGFDAVIHLAGEPIAGRWTAPKIRAVRESRVERTRQLAVAISRLKSPPRSFLCASQGDGSMCRHPSKTASPQSSFLKR